MQSPSVQVVSSGQSACCVHATRSQKPDAVQPNIGVGQTLLTHRSIPQVPPLKHVRPGAQSAFVVQTAWQVPNLHSAITPQSLSPQPEHNPPGAVRVQLRNPLAMISHSRVSVHCPIGRSLYGSSLFTGTSASSAASTGSRTSSSFVDASEVSSSTSCATSSEASVAESSVSVVSSVSACSISVVTSFCSLSTS